MVVARAEHTDKLGFAFGQILVHETPCLEQTPGFDAKCRTSRPKMEHEGHAEILPAVAAPAVRPPLSLIVRPFS